MADRRLLLAGMASAVAAVLFSAVVHSNLSTPNIYSDIGSFWGRSWVAAGEVPYSSANAFLEYPPLSGLFLYAAQVLGAYFSNAAGGPYLGYFDSFSAISLVAAAVMGWSTWRVARALGRDLNPVYFLLPSMLIYGVYNFDLFDALFVILALQFFLEKRPGWSAVLLGAAVATKGIAVVLLPLFLLELAGRGPRLKYLAVSLAAAGVCFFPIAVFNFGWFHQFISYFSTWGLEDAWYIWIPWFSSPFSHAAKAFGYVVVGLLLLRVYTLKMPLVPRSFLALTAYLLGTYIYAPQFNVTLVPIIAVLGVATPSLYFFDVFNAFIILTWFVTPSVIGGGACPPASGTDPTWCPTWAWTYPQLMALLRSASLALVGLSVASNSGHSLAGWLRARIRSAPASP